MDKLGKIESAARTGSTRKATLVHAYGLEIGYTVKLKPLSQFKSLYD
jgi:hypothetical protein